MRGYALVLGVWLICGSGCDSVQQTAKPTAQESSKPSVEKPKIEATKGADEREDALRPELEDVGVPLDVQRFYLQFRRAVLEGNRETVANMINYPITVNLDGDLKSPATIQSSKEFLELYEKAMTKPLRTVIEKHGLDRLHGSKEGPVSLYRGQMYMFYACPRANEICEEGPVRVLRIWNDPRWMD